MQEAKLQVMAIADFIIFTATTNHPTMEDLKYPIGKFKPQPYDDYLRKKWLVDIAQLPNMLEAAILNLDEAQLHTPYRDGGWTIHEVVHHVADSHINCFCRIKLALTENNPTIRAYEESEWVKLADAKLPVNHALTLLHSLHIRLYELLKSLSTEDFQRTYVHGATGMHHTLWFLLGQYAWHGKHHVAHINSLRERKGWH